MNHTVKVSNGKYTFVKLAGGATIQILRHGEPWHEQTTAYNAIASMMAELDAARVVLQATRAHCRGTAPDNLLMAALELHDRLVLDSTPVKQAPEPAAASGGPNTPRADAVPDSVEKLRLRALLQQLELRARQWAAAERQADDRAAELDRATEAAAGPISRNLEGVRDAFLDAQAVARMSGRVEDDTREWLLEAARALLETP